MLCVGGGRKLTLDFTCGQTCKHGFSLLSNQRWKTHTTIIQLHMPLVLPPLTSGTFSDLTQVPEYESVFLRLLPAMVSGAYRRACKAHRICAALSVGHSTSAGHPSQVGNWSGKTASFVRDWFWRKKFTWKPPSSCQYW